MSFGTQFYKVQVYARTRDRYYTFCTPECAKAINEYQDYRRRCGELIKDESPLFRRQFSRFSINKPLPISQPSVMEAIDESLKKSGVKSSAKKVMRSHSFRKRFKTVCEQSGMKSINVELLLGHSIGVSNSYYRPAESDILEDYMIHAAADALTIDPTQKLQQENQELKFEQAQEIARLKAHLEAREEKDRKISEEWQALKREMDELRKFVFPGPVPQDKQMRKTFLKVVKSYYKDEKGIGIDVDDVSNNLE